MKTKMYLIIFLFMSVCSINAQSFNSDKVAFTNFLVRMYNNAPFDGVRAVTDDDNNAYLLSVLALDGSKYPSESVFYRVASVKAMSQASRYFNGSNITDEMIIHTVEKSNGTSDTEIIENIREYSLGYVKSLEQLTNFKRKDGQTVFIFMTPLTSPANNKG